MKFDEVVRRGGKAFRANSPLLLSVAAGTGVLTTAYLSARAGYIAAGIIEKEESEVGTPVFTSKYEQLKERARLSWRVYVPGAIAGVGTVVCIVGSARVNNRRVAAAQTAYSLTAATLEQYRGKVAEALGVGKERALRDDIAQERVVSNPPGSGLVIGTGKVLCCELFTGRYFESDMEALRRAENTVNQRLIREMYCIMTEFYWEVGLPPTSYSSEVGWEAGKPMELRFTSVLNEGKPCLAFEYNYVKTL